MSAKLETWKYSPKSQQVFEVNSGEQICSVVRDMWTREQHTAHGHLMASAPELLAALEMCITVMDDPPSAFRMNDTDAFRNARAAIAKSKGEA